jgi:hypothetical protein
VTTPLVAACSAVAALVVLLGVASTLLGRRTGYVHLAAAGLLEVLLLVQAGVAVAALVGGRRLVETSTFLGYLAGVVLVPVAGVLWSRTERSRWAGTVLAVAAAVAGVMVWRLVRLWDAPGA